MVQTELALPLLTGLGDTPKEIALALRKNSVCGVRNTARHLNPIVRYARLALPEAQNIHLIKPGFMRIELPNAKLVEINLPSPVIRFLEEFNAGQYPDLEMMV